MDLPKVLPQLLFTWTYTWTVTANILTLCIVCVVFLKLDLTSCDLGLAMASQARQLLDLLKTGGRVASSISPCTTIWQPGALSS